MLAIAAIIGWSYMLCAAAVAPRPHAPALHSSNPLQHDRFNSLTNQWVLTRTIDWSNRYPGYHLRFSRTTQSAGGPCVTRLRCRDVRYFALGSKHTGPVVVMM